MVRSLYINQIRDEGAAMIGEALKTNAALTELRCVDGGRHGCKYQLMVANFNCTHSLGDNQIGDDGAAAIGEALKTNAALSVLQCVDGAHTAPKKVTVGTVGRGG